MIVPLEIVVAAILAQNALRPDASPAAPPCSLAATASKTEVTVGEIFTIEVKANGPAGTVWTFPAEVLAETIELRTPARDEKSPGPPADAHLYDAAVFALGDASVPAISVRYRLVDGTGGEVRSDPIPLRIASVLPKDPKEQRLADIRGPMPLAIDRAFYIALALLALASAAVVWTLLRWRRKRRPGEPQAPPLPVVEPDVEAREALAQLAARELVERGEFRAFYIVLSEIAKRYLERRLERPVLEMTSTETVAFLRVHPHASDLASQTRELVGAADHVKFARGLGLEQEAQRHLQFVRSMIDALEGRLHPRAADETARVNKVA